MAEARVTPRAADSASDGGEDVDARQVTDGELRRTCLPRHRVTSPSKMGSQRLLRPELADFSVRAPLSLAAQVPSSFVTLWGALQTSTSSPLGSWFSEQPHYPLLTCFLPPWVTAPPRQGTAKQNAAALYGPVEELDQSPLLTLPWQCEPEVFATAAAWHPAFTGEGKSVEDNAMNQLLTYLLFGIIHSSFRRSPSGRGRCFHSRPPVGYGVLAFANLGYIVGVECVGKLFAYPLSQPFVLGSQEHAQAVAALPATPLLLEESVLVPPVEDEQLRWSVHPRLGPAHVSWTIAAAAGGRFWKVLECTAFDSLPQGGAEYIRALYGVYERYARARAEAHASDPPPSSLAEARLLFGQFELLVDMPFLGTRSARAEDLAQCDVLAAVAAALGWLARRGLLYVDLRPANVRVEEGVPGSAWLIDYDDMVLLEGPCESAEQLVAALRTNPHGCAALDAMPALAEALAAAWPQNLER